MEIRLFKKDESDLYMQAINDIWKKGHILSRDKTLCDYMFYHNPMHEKYIGKNNYGAIGIWEDNKIIGLGGLILFEFNLNGLTRLASNVTNSIVLKEYRKTMAGMLLYEKPIELYSPFCSFGIGLSQYAMRVSPSMVTKNFIRQPIYRLNRLLGIFNKEKTTELLLKNNVDYLRNYCKVEKVPQHGEKIVAQELDKDKWNSFYYNDIAKKTISISRNYDFLCWRYLKHPTFKYLVYTVQDENKNYEGLLVARVESILNKSAQILRILEFISKNQDASIALANKVVDIGLENEILFADFYCTTDMFNFGLDSVGFKKEYITEEDEVVLPCRFQPVDLTVTSLNAVISFYGKDVKNINLLNNNIYFTKGDSDQDRPN
jgi:hypothetical protein